MYNKTQKLILAMLTLVLIGCAGKSDDKDTTLVPSQEVSQDAINPNNSVADELKTQLEEVKQAPVLTLVLLFKGDVQEGIDKLKKNGGKLIYDPNNGEGSTIPFVIAELAPDLIANTEFINSLKLNAASIDSAQNKKSLIETKIASNDAHFTNFIPTDSVKISELGVPSELGKDVTVAVIDTGIDASHPAFNGRVVYWYDGTQETRTKLARLNVEGQSTTVSLNGKKYQIKIPEIIDSTHEEVYGAIMSEKAFIAQMPESSQNEVGFYDLNTNESADDYLVIVTKSEDKIKVYFDVNADMKIVEEEQSHKIPYNNTERDNRVDGMITFPTRNNIVSYPILFEEDEDGLFIGLGKTEGMHGTHVAGIIAANDPDNNLMGAAPNANLMSLKVCSGISCTDAAIIRGLYKAFYNGKHIPDVVNISLGSHEDYKRDIYSYVLNDLSAKFGTIFFISASNSGPGFRSLNHFGNLGPVVMVGANVSQKTLRDQYNLPSSVGTQKENLLFFSSVGPSYTSEMKPNIMAPGAAISTVPAAGNYMNQANGTSMSSPLAAGAFAAILAKAKQEMPESFNVFTEMREYHLSRSTEAKTSLLPYVYMMRDALHLGASEQPNLTRAQQGYGLLDAGSTYKMLKTSIESLSSGDRDYFEVVINNYGKSYDRTGETKDVQSFSLSLGQDGERTKESLAQIISKGLDIHLDRVEILSTDGKVTRLNNSSALKYFSIVVLGDEARTSLKTHVAFNNSRNTNFYSRRFLKQMQDGNTYIAHYKISQRGVNVANILDVVHRPIKLKKSKVNVPYINSKVKNVSHGFGVHAEEIGANVFHRYPVYVDKNTISLKVQAALASTEGRVYVQIYNPDGKETEFVVAQDASIMARVDANISTSTLKEGKVQTGIWEVTLSTASSSWLGKTSYDLLIEAEKFGITKDEILLSGNKELELPVLTNGEKISSVFIQDLNKIIREKVIVKANHVSFHKLNVSKDYVGTVNLSIDDPSYDSKYWGSLKPNLYTKKNGKFVVYKKGVTHSGSSFKLTKELEDDVYFAYNTLSNYESSENGKLEAQSEIVVLVKTSSKDKISISHEVVDFSDLDLAVLKLKRDTEIDGEYEAELVLSSATTSTVTDINGQERTITNKDGKTFKIPLRIK